MVPGWGLATRRCAVSRIAVHASSVGDYHKTFDFDDEELAALVEDGTALSDDDMIRVARNCPSRAILIFDQDNKLGCDLIMTQSVKAAGSIIVTGAGSGIGEAIARAAAAAGYRE